jgi:hypothetical protein
MSHIRLVAGAALSAAIVALPLAASAATASQVTLGTTGDLTYVRNTVSIAPNAFAIVTAVCPAGTHVAGGGVDAGNLAPTTVVSGVWPFDSPKDADSLVDDGMRARVWNGATSDTTAKVYAECSTALPLYGHKTQSVSGNTVLTATTSCSSNTKVIGGGARTVGPADVTSLASTSPVDGADSNTAADDAWQVLVYNGDSVAHDIEYYGICWSHPVSYRTAASTSGSFASTDTNQLACQAGDHLISPGISYGGDNSQFDTLRLKPMDDGTDVNVTPDDKAGFAWRDSDSTSNALTFFTVCEPN